MPNFEKGIPDAVFFLRVRRQHYPMNYGWVTYAQGHKVLAPLHHVRYASTDMCDPTRYGLKFLVQHMHAPVHIGNHYAIRRGRDGRNRGRDAQHMRALSKVMCVSNEYDIEEWELSPLRRLSDRNKRVTQHVLPAQKLLTTLPQSF